MAKNIAFKVVAAVIAVALFVLGGTALAVSQKTKVAPIPYIRVLSPNGGETYRPGQKVKIKWQSAGVSRVQIILIKDGMDELSVNLADGKSLRASAKQFTWTVPPDRIYPGSLEVESGLRILIQGQDVNKNDVRDSSDAGFSIVAKPKSGIVYTNTDYDFSLTLPQTWKGFTAKSRTLDWGDFGESDSIDFGFMAQEDVFNISIHSKSQWQKIKSDEGPAPTYLGENSQYIFAYTTAQDAVNDIIAARMREVSNGKLIKMFRLLHPAKDYLNEKPLVSQTLP